MKNMFRFEIVVVVITATAAARIFPLNAVEAYHTTASGRDNSLLLATDRPRTTGNHAATAAFTTTSGSLEKRQVCTPSTTSTTTTTNLISPGGGIYFFWQAGVVTFLRENGYFRPPHQEQQPQQQHQQHSTPRFCSLTGASAGALTATLAATGVDFYEATELALSLADQSDVWCRSGGLQGIWGDLIYEWLHQLIPATAVEELQQPRRHKLTLLVTPFPNVWDPKLKVRSFRDKNDLIAANMASIHLPWFLNSQFTATFRGQSVLDGSFLAQAEDYYCDDVGKAEMAFTEEGVNKQHYSNNIVIDYKMDPLYRNQRMLSFIESVEPSKIRQMMEDGKRYAQQLEAQGYFASLHDA